MKREETIKILGDNYSIAFREGYIFGTEHGLIAIEKVGKENAITVMKAMIKEIRKELEEGK